MKIRKINVWKEDLELTRPYTIAFKTVSKVENCIVEIETDSGHIGLGSGSPSEQVTGESLRDTITALSEENLAWLIGKDIREYRQLCFETGLKFNKTPAARAALDIALHDVFTNYLDMPLATFLGHKIKALPTSITIGIKTVEESLKEAQEYIDRKFKIIKVKLGKNLEEDLEVLAKLRENFGHSIAIRIDANQGYDSQTLTDFYKKSIDYDIELIEQPLPAKAIRELKALPSEIKEKIAADESLISPDDAFKLAETPQACGIFNIKLMKCGGVTRAKEIATIAENAAIDLMWGCNDESIISISAALHTALSCPSTKYIDLDGSLDLARDVVDGGFIIEDGMMRISGLPGLGVNKLGTSVKSSVE